MQQIWNPWAEKEKKPFDSFSFSFSFSFSLSLSLSPPLSISNAFVFSLLYFKHLMKLFF